MLQIGGCGPIWAPAVDGAKRVSVGAAHICVLDESGQIFCWGDSSYGQTGVQGAAAISVTDFRANPVQASIDARSVDICSGGYHNCAALEDGTVRCWGANSVLIEAPADVLFYTGMIGVPGSGSHGDSERIDSIPALDFGERVVEVDCSGSGTCARTETGNIHCWGWSEDGHLAFPDGVESIGWLERADSVAGAVLPTSANSISIGIARSCMIDQHGRALCWGRANPDDLLGTTEEDVSNPADGALLDFGDTIEEICVGLRLQLRCREWQRPLLGF